MAPSAKKLEAALLKATNQIFQAEPDATTVNKVRKQAESDLDLDEDFFLSGEWKSKSKSIIKTQVVCLLSQLCKSKWQLMWGVAGETT